MPTNKKSYNEALETARAISQQNKYVKYWILDAPYKRAVVIGNPQLIEQYEKQGYKKRALYIQGHRVRKSEW